jgi:hypothetical protein
MIQQDNWGNPGNHMFVSRTPVPDILAIFQHSCCLEVSEVAILRRTYRISLSQHGKQRRSKFCISWTSSIPNLYVRSRRPSHHSNPPMVLLNLLPRPDH